MRPLFSALFALLYLRTSIGDGKTKTRSATISLLTVVTRWKVEDCVETFGWDVLFVLANLIDRSRLHSRFRVANGIANEMFNMLAAQEVRES
jgi:hypothetical protein